MKNIIKLSLLTLLALPMFAGCANRGDSGNAEQKVNQESNIAFNLVSVSYAKFSSADGLGLAGAYLTKECTTPNGFKFEYTYSLKASTDEYMMEYVSLRDDGLTVDVIIPEIWELPIENQMFAAYTLTGKAVFKGASKDESKYSSFVNKEVGSKNWNIKVNAVETRPVIEKISTVKTGHSDGDTVIIRGYVSGYFEKSAANFYTGVFVSDGPDTVMLYSGSLDNYMNDMTIGTLVQVIATWSAYNGLVELKPQSGGIAILQNDETIAPAVVVDYTPNQFVNLKSAQSGNLCRVEGLTITDTAETIAALKTGSHWTLHATAGGKDINIYVNYHVGDDAQAAIKALLTANLTKSLTFVGTVGFYNSPQLSPLVSLATETAAACFQFAA